MNLSKPQQQTSSKKQFINSFFVQQSTRNGATNTPPTTPNSRKPNPRRSHQSQQQNVSGGANKKRNSPNQMDFLSFQPALQDCFQTPPQHRRSSPRGNGNGSNNGNTLISQSSKFSTKVNGFNNSLSPIKLSSPAIAPIIRQGQQQSNSARRQTRGSPPTLFKHTPFAGAKYLELPSTKDLPLPPAWLLAAPSTTLSSSSSNEEETSSQSSTSSSPISMCEPPSPTTEAAIRIAKENGFDGRIRIHPLQLIAAVSSS